MKRILHISMSLLVTLLSACGRDGGAAVEASSVPLVSADTMSAVAKARIFFGHQSVGMNIIEGVSELAASAGYVAPRAVESRDAPSGDGGFLAHTFIGQNMNPALKIADFDKIIRGGVGNRVDIALMKLCYVDVGQDTDVSALFGQYKSTLDALERDFPRVKFLHVTIPLTRDEPGLKSTLRRMRRGNANAARESMNALLRDKYAATGRLFDLAKIESTSPDGTRTRYGQEGGYYFTLHPAWASDDAGHLNAQGRSVAAKGLLDVIYRALDGESK